MVILSTLQEIPVGGATLPIKAVTVEALQRALRRAGFDPGPIPHNHPAGSGGFHAGSQTAIAVRNFQAANGLPVNGIVGPEMWEALPDEDMQGLPTLALGSEGGAVALLQRMLRGHGFNPGTMNGVFGPSTEQSVRGVQNLHEIVVDGVVGDQTWTVIH